MSDRVVYLAENGRQASRGLSRASDGAWYTALADGEVDTFTIDASAWLQTGETIASVERTADGATITGTSNTTTRAIQNLSGVGDAVINLVTSTGREKQVWFRVEDRPRTETPAL